MATGDEDVLLRFELKNSRPVDLLDLTDAWMALGEAYQEYAVQTFDLEPGNVRLFVRTITSGSVIADLASIADQASFILHHMDVVAGFIGHLNEVINFFLPVLRPAILPELIPPSKREATQITKILEPTAKDAGAQFNIGRIDGDFHFHQHIHVNSQQANAVQNSARRFLGPSLPSNQVYQDQLLVLSQVRGDAAAQVGDRGVIETISTNPVKLQFISEDDKKKIVNQPDNPFEKIYIVDVEARASEGKVRMYRILSVKDTIDR